MYGGGGANKPLTNSLTTSNTLKNSNPKELSKNLNKIQSSNLSKESNSKIQDSIKLESIKDSNSIQSKQSKTTITKIGISIVASIVLSQSLVALPSGGKFVGGSSGSIKVNDKVMNITGNNTNHIIAWGGGFNINKGEIVEFNTSHKQQASFLNLDYSNQASKILGQLKGNNHNIYLVNPSGVLIGQNANINANKFVASNTIDETTLNSFKSKVNDSNAITTFSPVFKPNKGNIVNLGTIKANNGITLIGDTIDIRGGKIENTSGGTDKDDSIYFVGENIYIDADAANLSSNNNIYATAFKEGYIQRQMKNFQKDNFSFISNGGTLKTDSIGYDYFENGTITNNKIGQKDFKKAITLGNGNADEALSEWYWFANGWYNNKGDTRSVDEFRLVGDIDFSKQLDGKDRYIIDFSKNENSGSFKYSGNYNDFNEIGFSNNKIFNFDGNGHTLRNISDGGRIFALYGGTIQNLIFENLELKSPIFYVSNKSYVNNITVNKINVSIDSNVSAFGQISNSVISNIIMNDVNVKGSEQIAGFSEYIADSKLYNITMNNVKVESNQKSDINGNTAYVGGFVSEISGNNEFRNITLNNIEVIGKRKEHTGMSDETIVGGFVSRIYGGSNNSFNNIVLNNIKTIKATQYESNVKDLVAGGFVGRIQGGSDNVFDNIYMYFNPSSAIVVECEIGTCSVFSEEPYIGKFYGDLDNHNGQTIDAFSNIHIYYKDKTLGNATADSNNYNQANNGSIVDDKINLHTYSDSAQGKEIFKQALEKQNNLGGAFESNKIVNIGDDSNPIYSFEQTTGSNITPPTDSNTPNIDLGNVVLEGSDFSVSILQEIINDILNGKYGINIDNREVLSNLAESLNNANTLQDYFNAINSYLISSSLDESTKESIRQSMDFLVAFYGENGLGNKFKGDTNYKDFYDKTFYISTSLKDLGNFISGDLNGRLDSIIKNIQILESLKQRIKAAQKYYQEALEAKLPYETLEGIYNEMVKIIDESYAKAQSLLNTLESEDEVYLTNLLGEYSIKENSDFDDITGTFTFNGENLQANLNKTILAGLSDKPNLTPPTKEEVGDDPTKENNPDVPNNLQKIADLASKEAILILPAQEKQEAIVEDGKERGRLCIVSDNAKTNNPCMAITY